MTNNILFTSTDSNNTIPPISFPYEQIKFTSIEDITSCNNAIYVDITSSEVWVNTNININCKFITLHTKSRMKIDRYSKQSDLRVNMLKPLITVWNYCLHNEDKNQIKKNNYIINEYLHYHYFINSYTLFINSSVGNNNFNWDHELSNYYNIDLTINAKFLILEEILYNVLKKQIAKITIEHVNMVWSDFRALSSFDDFRVSTKVENEFNTMKANFKSMLYNMGKENEIYLYFSKIKLKEEYLDYSSSSLIASNEDAKQKLHFIICPKVQEIKSKTIKKKLPVSKYIETSSSNKQPTFNDNTYSNQLISMEIPNSNINLSGTISPSSGGNTGSSGTKKSFHHPNMKMKVFKESPFEDSFGNVGDNQQEQTHVDMPHKKQVSHQANNSNNSLNVDNVSNIKHIEEVNKAAKEIYKTYEQNDNDLLMVVNEDSNSSKIKEKNGMCQEICQLIREARKPSTNLRLNKQIQKMINKSVCKKILETNDMVKLKRNEMEKFALPQIVDVDYTFEFQEEKVFVLNTNETEIMMKAFDKEFQAVIVLMCGLVIIAFIIIDIIEHKK